MKQCEVVIVKALQQFGCHLSMRDTVIDGKTVERMIMPVPDGFDPKVVWELFDMETARVKGMMLDGGKTG